MKIIKRNGVEAVFEAKKIYFAVLKANYAVEPQHRITDLQIQQITDRVTELCSQMACTPGVEDVQDLVEKEIMAQGAFALASALKSSINLGLIREYPISVG